MKEEEKQKQKQKQMEDNEDEAMFEMASSTESNSQPKKPKPEKEKGKDKEPAPPEIAAKSPVDDSFRKSISEIESPASDAQYFSFQQNDTFQQLQQQQQQSKSRKLSLKEKRKLRAERELTPRDLEIAALPGGVVTPPYQPPESSQTLPKQFLSHPPVSGGSPSPTGRSGDSDHSNRSELSPSQPEGAENGANFAVQLPSRDRAASREFAVSRALGKYREKQKQQQNSQSNSDSQEELERTPNSTTPTPKSSPPRISMIEPEMEVTEEEKEIVIQAAAESAKKCEADIEATLKNLDAKLAEFEGSIKPVSEFVPAVTGGTDEEEEEEEEKTGGIVESKDTEDDIEEDYDEEGMDEGPSSSDDGSPEMEMDTSANEDNLDDQPGPPLKIESLPEKEPLKEPEKEHHTTLHDLAAMDATQLQDKAEKAASDAAVKAEKAATDAAVKAEKAATEAAVKAEKVATETAVKAAKVATTAFSLFGASKFGKQLVAAAASAQAAATTATKLPKQKENISRVGSRRQSTEESIDTDDEWYRHEMRELEELEYEKHVEQIRPSQSVTHQMNLALKELCSVKPPIEKGTCDFVEAERMTAQNAMPGPTTEKVTSPLEEEKKADAKRPLMRFQSSDDDNDDDEDEEFQEEEEEEEEEEVEFEPKEKIRAKVRHKRRQKSDSSDSDEEEEEDATQSGPDSLIQDSSDDLLESDSKKKSAANTAVPPVEKEESSPSEPQAEISQASQNSHPSSGKASLSGSLRAGLMGPRPGSSGSGRFNGQQKSPPKESPPGSGEKADEEYWDNTAAATGGYYDENGEWVEANGYYDENGYWIETGGYYDESGAWIEYAGYYDENNEWVEVENTQQQQQQQQEQNYYDDGGGGGGGTIETTMPTVVEEEPVEVEQEENINNTAGHFLAVAGVAVTMPPMQSTPATKQSTARNGHGDDSCSSSYTDEAGEDDDQDMDDLEEEVPEVYPSASMSKQQSEDLSTAESKGSGNKSRFVESELLSEEINVTSADVQNQLSENDLQNQEQDQPVEGEPKLTEDESEEAKETLADIMAKRKIAGNKGWSALSKTLRDRKSELLEAAGVRLKLV